MDTKPEDPMDAELEKFARKAKAMLAEFAETAAAIEKRLTERAEARAIDQSKVMAKYEGELRVVVEKNAEYGRVVASMAARQIDQDKTNNDIRRHIGESDERVKAVLTTCEAIDAKAGDRFGKRVEALGAQVAQLVSMGKRLENVERTTKATGELVLTASGDLKLLEIEARALVDRMAALEKPAEPPKAKAAAAKAGA